MLKYRSGFFAVVLLWTVVVSGTMPRAQSGGDFVITQTVVAGGGQMSIDAGNSFSIAGTVGQPNAGDDSTGSAFNLKTGFWTPSFVPTAANATVTGRVLREGGAGVRGVTVTLIGGTLIEPRTCLTSSLGYFIFEDLPVGSAYVVTVSHPKFGFTEPTRAFLLLDDLKGVDFVATW